MERVKSLGGAGVLEVETHRSHTDGAGPSDQEKTTWKNCVQTEAEPAVFGSTYIYCELATAHGFGEENRQFVKALVSLQQTQRKIKYNRFSEDFSHFHLHMPQPHKSTCAGFASTFRCLNFKINRPIERVAIEQLQKA